MTSRVYATCFDHRYLPRGLALIESLRRHGCNDPVFVLCFNQLAMDAMRKLALDNVRLVDFAELEAVYPGLAAARENRATIEYYYTCTPAITEYALLQTPEASAVAYLDADLWFFDDPELVFGLMGEAPVAIIPHNFAPSRKSAERFGIYNVGWVGFARSSEGLNCLAWWHERCAEWCYGRIDGDRFADQGYLNHFAQVAAGTRILTHKGVNTAPWNIDNYQVSSRDGRVWLDGDPLIFFHFHGVDRHLGIFYFDNHRLYGAQYNAIIRNHLYRPYIAALLGKEALARQILPQAGQGRVDLRGSRFLGLDLKNLRRKAMRLAFEIMDLAQGRPILVWNGQAR